MRIKILIVVNDEVAATFEDIEDYDLSKVVARGLLSAEVMEAVEAAQEEN